MQNQKIETVTITDFSSQGLGVGRRASGQVAMIPYTVPGDQAEVDFEFAKPKGIAFGKLMSISSSSDDRGTHPCIHYSQGCRGSLLGAYDYKKGLTWKRNHLLTTLERIGKLKSPDVREVYPSPLEWNYRDRLEFQLQLKPGRIQIGFMGDNGIIPIKTCCLSMNHIQDCLQNMLKTISTLKVDTVREDCRLLFRDNGLGQAVAVLFITDESTENYELLTRLLQQSGLARWEIRQVDDFKLRFVSSKLIEMVGETFIYVKFGRYSMELPLLSFTQTNPSAAALLRRLVIDLIPDKANLLDLYGGYGAFALEYVNRKSGSALVLESSHSMVKAGREFAKKVSLPVKFLQSDLNYPVSINKSFGQFDVVIADPPRDGLHRNVIKYLNTNGPKQLIYVSCHTAALARDIKELKRYTPEYFIPVDMFANTARLETIALFTRTA